MRELYADTVGARSAEKALQRASSVDALERCVSSVLADQPSAHDCTSFPGQQCRTALIFKDD